MRVIASYDAAYGVPDVPITSAVSALDEDEPSACCEATVDGLRAAVSGVAADFGDAC